MRRESSIPRPDWPAKVEAQGLAFHTQDGIPYWDETACYVFTSLEVDAIEEATDNLHALCLETVDALIAAGDLARLSIPQAYWPWIAESWRRRDPEIYGRFDLVYDGSSSPKMLEYNADTPTALVEAAVAQWFWLEDTKRGHDQFNIIHERLIEAWKRVRQRAMSGWSAHFAGALDDAEDFATIEYMRDVASQAGFPTIPLDIAHIGWNGHDFTDLQEKPINLLFKLYPWEWMLREEFGPHAIADRTAFIEPPWKMVLSNKAILPVLWERYPGHPNLLPASFRRADFTGACIEKPVHGREGTDVRRLSSGEIGQATVGEAGISNAGHDWVYQELCPLPVFDGRHALIGSWVIDSRASGIGLREDDQSITRNTSRFVPHYFD